MLCKYTCILNMIACHDTLFLFGRLAADFRPLCIINQGVSYLSPSISRNACCFHRSAFVLPVPSMRNAPLTRLCISNLFKSVPASHCTSGYFVEWHAYSMTAERSSFTLMRCSLIINQFCRDKGHTHSEVSQFLRNRNSLFLFFGESDH